MKGHQPYSDEESIKRAAPVLFSLDRRGSPFHIPEHYFSEFPSKVSSLVLLRKEDSFSTPVGYFEALPEHLEKLTLQKKNGGTFEAPAGYFERLPHSMQNKVLERGPVAKNPVYPRLVIPVLAAAAVAVLTLGILLNLRKEEGQGPLALNSVSISPEEAEGGLLESADEQFLIEQVVASAEPDRNHEAWSDYLIENQVDLQTLANEL